MFNKIGAWWRWNGRYMHNDFARGVKNLWRWFPTIWKDRDWDGHYIYELLRKKIEFQAEYIDSRGFHTEAKRDAERMRLVARLIKFQQDETYGMEYMDYETTEIWFEPCKDKPDFSEMKSKTTEEKYDEFFSKYPRQHKRALSGDLNRFKRSKIDPENKHLLAMEISHGNQERCRKLIFSIMHDHIERWWD